MIDPDGMDAIDDQLHEAYDKWNKKVDFENEAETEVKQSDGDTKPKQGNGNPFSRKGLQVRPAAKGFWEKLDFYVFGWKFDGYDVDINGKIASDFKIIELNIADNPVFSLRRVREKPHCLKMH